MNEKQVQRDVVRCYERLGCIVYTLSQPRATMQTPGLPDLWVFAPRKNRAWWHETKAEGGKPSAAQIDFMAQCLAANVGHVMGGLAEAKAQLTHVGLIARVA